MKRITFVLALLLLCVPQFIGAQTIKVTGTVTSASEKYPLEGAGVMIKGTKIGVATDYNGQFVINARKDAALVFSSVGYKTTEVPVNGRSVINVTLEDDATTLETAIVVGYGTAKKISNVVGAASTVKAKALKDRPVINTGDALQGQVAGLQVFSSSGDPSATVSMRLRGVNSIYASTDPLFILDGSPVLASVFSTLNANDIESVTVLKDASSTAIYGSRAANGVVYITTKKGTGDKPTIKVSAHYGLSNLARFPIRMMNAKEWFAFSEICDPSLVSNTQFQALKQFRLSNDIHTNWRKWILNQNAPSMGGDMTISGRTNRTDYYVSLNVFRQEGVEPSSNMNRFGTRVNINTKATDWFKVGLNLGLTYDLHHSTAFSGSGNSWYNPLNIATWSLPYTTPYEILTDENGNFTGYGKEQDYMSDWGGYNWKYLSKYQPSKYSYVRLNGNLYEDFTPIEGLDIKFAQALEGYDYRASSKALPNPLGILTKRATESFTRFYRMTSTNTIEYKFALGENHNFTVLGGQEAIISNSEGFSASSTGQTDLRLKLISVAQGTTNGKPGYSYTDTRYNSLFSRVSYDYAGKYFIDGSFRRDGSSRFGADNRYANFYSVGIMWSAKKENFLKNVSWLDDLKFKASYGTVGNSGIGDYLSLGTVANGAVYNGNATWAISAISNPKLTWEKQKSLNVGVEFRMFDFFGANIEFYNKMTTNMLMAIPTSASTGYTYYWGNSGNMRNRGVEGTLTFDVVKNRNTMLTLSVNVSYNKDRITKLFNGYDHYALENEGLNLTVGHSYGEFYYVKYAGVDPANGRPLWYDKDGKITTEYLSSNAVLLGKKYTQYAPWAGGVQIDFAWKNFSLQAGFTGVFGRYLINNDAFFYANSNFVSESNQAAELLYKTWTTPGQRAKYPSPAYSLSVFDSRIVQNASFVRLKNVTLSYSLGKDVLSQLRVLQGVRIYVTGRNLLTFTKYQGWDPEVDSNLSLGRYPNTRDISAGVEFTF